jgi:hypothetical protein
VPGFQGRNLVTTIPTEDIMKRFNPKSIKKAAVTIRPTLPAMVSLFIKIYREPLPAIASYTIIIITGKIM